MKDQEKAVTNIISDHIIMERLSESMFTVNNVVRPNELDNGFNPIYNYHGYSIAFQIMGISENEELCIELSELFDEKVHSNENALILAKDIYKDWLVGIKNYFTRLKSA